MSENKRPAKQKKRSLIYAIARPIATVLMKTFIPVKYHNLERLDIDAPYIVISNHLSMFDPVIIGAAIKKHQVRFVGKKELCKNKLIAMLFRELRMISVDRHNSDMEAMRACMKVTRDGEILGIFPEGTRHHKGTMEELESGIGLIALRSKVPLMPIYISGKVRLFRRMHVYVGQAIPSEDLREQGINKETSDLLLKRITACYAEMQATAQ